MVKNRIFNLKIVFLETKNRNFDHDFGKYIF